MLMVIVGGGKPPPRVGKVIRGLMLSVVPVCVRGILTTVGVL